MRSTDNTPTPPTVTHAARFGALVAELALKAGYDVRPGGGGRAALARQTGMSPSAVGRMLDGKTLPMPHLFEPLARTIHTDVRTLLVTSGVISAHAWRNSSPVEVTSATSQQQQPPSPEDVADMWGITEPGIREMFLGNAQHAIRLQNEADRRGEAAGRR